MKCEIVGVERKSGVFTNEQGNSIAFDNFNLHVVNLGHVAGLSGKQTRIVKVKAENAGEMIAAAGGQPEKLVGHVFDFDLGNYGKLMSWELLK